MRKFVLAAVLACAFLTGCTRYYEVTDPGTGKSYYTKNIGRKRSGAVTLVDAKTKARITLQTSEIRRIHKDTFREKIAE